MILVFHFEGPYQTHNLVSPPNLVSSLKSYSYKNRKRSQGAHCLSYKKRDFPLKPTNLLGSFIQNYIANGLYECRLIARCLSRERENFLQENILQCKRFTRGLFPCAICFYNFLCRYSFSQTQVPNTVQSIEHGDSLLLCNCLPKRWQDPLLTILHITFALLALVDLPMTECTNTVTITLHEFCAERLKSIFGNCTAQRKYSSLLLVIEVNARQQDTNKTISRANHSAHCDCGLGLLTSNQQNLEHTSNNSFSYLMSVLVLPSCPRLLPVAREAM